MEQVHQTSSLVLQSNSDMVKELQYEDVAAVVNNTIQSGSRLYASHDLFGKYGTSATMVADIQVGDWNWDLSENIRVACGADPDLVFFSITGSGTIISEMDGLPSVDWHDRSKGGLFYWADGCRHLLKRGSQVSGLTYTLKADYLRQLVCNEGAWGETVARKLEKGEPFWYGDPTQLVTPQTRFQIEQIRNISSKGISGLLLQSRVIELLFQQLENMKARIERQKANSSLKKQEIDQLYQLREILEQRFLEDFSLSQLARLALLNEFKLKKGFKQLFGTTLFGFIHRLRMEYACVLLRETSQTITEIAFTTGYQHAQHFSTAFKKFYGVSPSEWSRIGKNKSPGSTGTFS